MQGIHSLIKIASDMRFNHVWLLCSWSFTTPSNCLVKLNYTPQTRTNRGTFKSHRAVLEVKEKRGVHEMAEDDLTRFGAERRELWPSLISPQLFLLAHMGGESF